MAQNKKKKKKSAPMPPINPVRFMREKARNCEIYQCYANRFDEDQGMQQIVVIRKRPGGKFIFGCFLVDLFCLGVKDAMWNHSLFEEDIDNYLDNLSKAPGGINEISYAEAHNIVYGAIDFARKGGIEPHPDFGVAQYVLEPRDADIEHIDIEFGHDGKHLLIEGPTHTEKRYVPILRKNLGDDGFEYILTDLDYEPDEDDEMTSEEELNEYYADDEGEEFTEEEFEEQEEREMEEQYLADFSKIGEIFDTIINDIDKNPAKDSKK